MISTTVLGAGLVGGPIARNMATRGFDVTVVDLNPTNLARLKGYDHIVTKQADLSDPKQIQAHIKNADIVLSAMPESIGFQGLKTCVEAGKNVVDISFYAEDPRQLDALAKQTGATVIVDMGVAPGMSHLLVGDGYRRLDQTTSAHIFVGGLPVSKNSAMAYKAPFSPRGVLAEYTRPARFIKDACIQTVDALSLSQHLEFNEVGKLEASITDGLRSLLSTLKIPDMAEWTLRYPGHFDLVRKLIELGFLKETAIEVAGARVVPLELSAQLLIPLWKLEEGERDFTVMRIVVEGFKGGQNIKHTYDLYDEYDAATGIHSMARTTGYAATTAADMIVKGVFKKPGITVPEFLGAESQTYVDFMLDGLKQQGVHYRYSNSTFAVHEMLSKS